jgi:hypothetical protein
MFYNNHLLLAPSVERSVHRTMDEVPKLSNPGRYTSSSERFLNRQGQTVGFKVSTAVVMKSTIFWDMLLNRLHGVIAQKMGLALGTYCEIPFH